MLSEPDADRLRVALLGPWPSASGVAAGGVEAVTYTIATVLARRLDMDVHVVTWAATAGVDRTGEMTVHRVPVQRSLRNLTMGYFDRRRMERVVRDLRPGIVHAHGLTDYGLVGTASAAPCIVAVHGVAADETPHVRGWVNRARWWTLERRSDACLRAARYLTVPTEYSRSRIHPRADAVVEMIENPVDATYFDVHPTSGSEPVIACIGRLIPLKRVEDVLLACAYVRRDVPNVRLEIAGGEGDPGYSERLRAIVREHGLEDSALFHGFVEPSAVPALLARARVLVHASAQENAPVAVEQALAAGVPVVAARAGGLPSVVRDGVTGFLEPPHDPARLAARVVSLLSDPAVHSAFSAAARADARARFHPEAVCAKTVRLYERALGRTFSSTEPARVYT